MTKGFVEGSCATVDTIMAHLKPKAAQKFDIQDLVDADDYAEDVFDDTSCLHLIENRPERQILISSRKLVNSPRVGLSLKSDEDMEKVWLADYRYLSYPEYTQKAKGFIMLSMIR